MGYICFVSLRALISAASFPCLFERGHILLSRDRTGGVSFLFSNETSKKVNGFRSPFLIISDQVVLASLLSFDLETNARPFS